jgi:class 3 adenylate cyclase
MSIEEEILTPELRGQRTLAAIVFTDVVSFSMLMATNEEHTLDLLRRDFQIMKELCQRFEGKVIKTIGDALLMYFASAVKAVACAQEIQSSLAEITANLASDDILTHRIGIHLGDVFFNGTDVLGDGVNIAARLQAEAQPGGICLSQTVYEVVKNP